MSGTPDTAWPAFIVGSHRSGTTLLRFLLDSHERLACPPESKFVAALYNCLWYPQAYAALRSLGFTQAAINCRIRAFIMSFLDEYTLRQGKARWIDKTPNYTRLVTFIDEVFEQHVLYLVVVRHPLDCAASLMELLPMANFHDPDLTKAIDKFGTDLFACVRMWRDTYERLWLHIQQCGARCHIVKYETLTKSPATTLRAAVEFLGETYSDELIARAFRSRHTGGYEDTKIRKTREILESSVGKWRTWPEAEVQCLWEVVNDIALKWGYQNPIDESDDRPCSDGVAVKGDCTECNPFASRSPINK